MKNTVIIEIADGVILSVKSTIGGLELIVVDHDFDNTSVSKHKADYLPATETKEAIKQMKAENKEVF